MAHWRSSHQDERRFGGVDRALHCSHVRQYGRVGELGAINHMNGVRASRCDLLAQRTRVAPDDECVHFRRPERSRSGQHAQRGGCDATIPVFDKNQG